MDDNLTITTSDGSDSLSFGFRELTGAFSASQQFTIHNTSGSAITYDLSSEFTTVDGWADLSFSSNSVVSGS